MLKRKLLVTAFICIIAVSAVACGINMHHQEESLNETSSQTESSTAILLPEATTLIVIETVTHPAETVTTVATEPVIEPEHSAFYIPGLDVEDVILYFNEVCLDAEIVNEGNASLLQKWTEPIFYKVEGQPTEDDLAVISDFTAWLNAVEGFPGITQTQDQSKANLRIFFYTRENMLILMGDGFAGMDGAVTFWYQDNKIYNSIICIRTDIEQHLRNSVIQEEIYNGLGPIQDTALRPDSIIYSEYSEPQSLSEIDGLIMQLLYHPMMQCGIDAAECEAVIRQLYY